MSVRTRHIAGVLAGILPILSVLATVGCAGRAPEGATTRSWIAGRPEPIFDPQGPPEPLRWAIERLLSRGLTAEDSSGTIVPAAARSWEWSADSLTLTFHLRPGLRFSDGAPCGSADFRRTLLAGLARTDHGSQAWLLGAVAGVAQVRAGRPLPPLGIETPDDLTLLLRLTRPDPTLPGRLALPGVSAPWHGEPAGGWAAVAGLGAYRVLGEDVRHSLTLVRREESDGPDTIVVRFQPQAARVLTFLRARGADLVWPLPAGLDVTAAPPGMRPGSAVASPRRWLLLVMRADLPPTSRPAARQALAHAVNRDRVSGVLGGSAARVGDWLPGSGRFDFPAFDEAQVRDGMQRARLGSAFHVTMAYDADGVGAPVAKMLQGEWASLGIYVELKPLRGARLGQELLGGSSHLALVEAQPWSEDLTGALSQLVMPLRGPAVGNFRTGWRTREFDGWIGPHPGPGGPPAALVQVRLAEELVVLPLAEVPWTWLSRAEAAPSRFHPRFGPSCAEVPSPPQSAAP